MLMFCPGKKKVLSKFDKLSATQFDSFLSNNKFQAKVTNKLIMRLERQHCTWTNRQSLASCYLLSLTVSWVIETSHRYACYYCNTLLKYAVKVSPTVTWLIWQLGRSIKCQILYNNQFQAKVIDKLAMCLEMQHCASTNVKVWQTVTWLIWQLQLTFKRQIVV